MKAIVSPKIRYSVDAEYVIRFRALNVAFSSLSGIVWTRLVKKAPFQGSFYADTRVVVWTDGLTVTITWVAILNLSGIVWTAPEHPHNAKNNNKKKNSPHLIFHCPSYGQYCQSNAGLSDLIHNMYTVIDGQFVDCTVKIHRHFIYHLPAQ